VHMIEIAGLGEGTADVDELNRSLDEAWREILTSDASLAEAANILQVNPGELRMLKNTPIKVEANAGGMTGLELAYMVFVWIGSEVVLGELADVAKEELRKRFLQLWRKMLAPRLRNLRRGEEVGEDVDLERSG
jgi:hypothetical protein